MSSNIDLDKIHLGKSADQQYWDFKFYAGASSSAVPDGASSSFCELPAFELTFTEGALLPLAPACIFNFPDITSVPPYYPPKFTFSACEILKVENNVNVCNGSLILSSTGPLPQEEGAPNECTITLLGTIPCPEGASGVRGATGATGPTGPQGIPGLDGSNGERGPTGPIGPSGSSGLTGNIGPEGATGATGVPGDPGEIGATGATGLTGLTGPGGPPGVNGSDGTCLQCIVDDNAQQEATQPDLRIHYLFVNKIKTVEKPCCLTPNANEIDFCKGFFKFSTSNAQTGRATAGEIKNSAEWRYPAVYEPETCEQRFSGGTSNGPILNLSDVTQQGEDDPIGIYSTISPSSIQLASTIPERPGNLWLDSSTILFEPGGLGVFPQSNPSLQITPTDIAVQCDLCSKKTWIDCTGLESRYFLEITEDSPEINSSISLSYDSSSSYSPFVRLITNNSYSDLTNKRLYLYEKNENDIDYNSIKLDLDLEANIEIISTSSEGTLTNYAYLSGNNLNLKKFTEENNPYLNSVLSGDRLSFTADDTTPENPAGVINVGLDIINFTPYIKLDNLQESGSAVDIFYDKIQITSNDSENNDKRLILQLGTGDLMPSVYLADGDDRNVNIEPSCITLKTATSEASFCAEEGLSLSYLTESSGNNTFTVNGSNLSLIAPLDGTNNVTTVFADGTTGCITLKSLESEPKVLTICPGLGVSEPASITGLGRITLGDEKVVLDQAEGLTIKCDTPAKDIVLSCSEGLTGLNSITLGDNEVTLDHTSGLTLGTVNLDTDGLNIGTNTIFSSTGLEIGNDTEKIYLKFSAEGEIKDGLTIGDINLNKTDGLTLVVNSSYLKKDELKLTNDADASITIKPGEAIDSSQGFKVGTETILTDQNLTINETCSLSSTALNIGDTDASTTVTAGDVTVVSNLKTATLTGESITIDGNVFTPQEVTVCIDGQEKTVKILMTNPA
jgi:hypothetical protein